MDSPTPPAKRVGKHLSSKSSLTDLCNMANIGIQYYLLLCNHSALHCADMCTYDINKLWSKHGKGFKPKRSFLMQASFGAWRMHVFICNRFSVSFQVLCTKLLDISSPESVLHGSASTVCFLKAVSRWKSYLFYKEYFLCGVFQILPFQEQHSNQRWLFSSIAAYLGHMSWLIQGSNGLRMRRPWHTCRGWIMCRVLSLWRFHIPNTSTVAIAKLRTSSDW